VKRAETSKVVVPGPVWWPQWRLIHAGVATLQEIESHYSLADVVIANMALDVKIEAEREAHERAKIEARQR